MFFKAQVLFLLTTFLLPCLIEALPEARTKDDANAPCSDGGCRGTPINLKLGAENSTSSSSADLSSIVGPPVAVTTVTTTFTASVSLSTVQPVTITSGTALYTYTYILATVTETETETETQTETETESYTRTSFSATLSYTSYVFRTITSYVATLSSPTSPPSSLPSLSSLSSSLAFSSSTGDSSSSSETSTPTTTLPDSWMPRSTSYNSDYLATMSLDMSGMGPIWSTKTGRDRFPTQTPNMTIGKRRKRGVRVDEGSGKVRWTVKNGDEVEDELEEEI